MNKLERFKLKIDIFKDVLINIKKLSTASTLKVSCLALKTDFSKIASFGYNGSYRGANINPETGTEEESLEPGESGFIHAEINMIAKFKEPDPENYIVLLSLSPCNVCTKVLINAGFKYVYWLEEYRETKHLKIFDECNVECGNINKLYTDIILI